MDRPVPHSEEAEESVVASILVDPECLREIDVVADDFFVPREKLIFQAILRLEEQGVGINQVTVGRELQRQGELAEAGGLSHLSHLVANLPTSLHCKHYAKVVREDSTRRQLLELSARISSLAYESSTADKALTDADSLLVKLRKQRSILEVLEPVDRADAMLERYTNLKEHANTVMVPTGLRALDRELGGGLGDGQLVILAAATGLGKSTLAQEIANTVADKTGRVLFCSAEMTQNGLDDRDIARMTGIDIRTIMAGNYDDQTYTNIVGCLGAIEKRNIYHLPRGRMTTARISQAAEAISNRSGPLRLIVVDYIQRVKPRDTKQQRYQQVGEITGDLSDIAKDFSCPVLALSQITRDIRERNDKRPQLTDLRESADIEQDADLVLLLWRLAYYYQHSEYLNVYSDHKEWHGCYDRYSYPEKVSELTIAKQRQGGGISRRLKLVYNPQHGFGELA